MLALGIDTSAAVGSVGLWGDDGARCELNLSDDRTHSEQLLPAIRALLETSGARARDIDIIAVASGPGSFTGLRIGMATAKGLAIALGRPLVGFSTLETIALAVSSRGTGQTQGTTTLCVLLEAGRGELYRGVYRWSMGRIETLVAEACMSPERVAEGLPADCLVVGALGELEAATRAALGTLRPIRATRPTLGAALAGRAVALAQESGLDRLPPLAPNYLRPSDAELSYRG